MAEPKEMPDASLINPSRRGGYPCVFKKMQHQDHSDGNPTKVWDASTVEGFPWLFVGSLSAAENQKELLAHNVTRILTVAGKLRVAEPPLSCHHVKIDIDDHPLANFLTMTQQCIDFLDAAAKDVDLWLRESGDEKDKPPPSVLVHCASGISRSVSAVMTWLMIRKGYTLDGALVAIRVHRPLGNPNVGFQQQLHMLEKCQGNLKAALDEWNRHSQKDIWELTSSRRRKANDLHARVDDLEVRIQQYSSSLKNNKNDKATTNKDEDAKELSVMTNASALSQEANVLSNELDEANSDTEGLPLDKVTRCVLKSARNKLEREISLRFAVAHQHAFISPTCCTGPKLPNTYFGFIQEGR